MPARAVGGGGRRRPRRRLPRSALLAVVLGRDVEVGELLGEARVRPAVAERGELLLVEAEAGQPVALAEAELGGQILAVEQPDLVGARERLGRFDLDPPVALEPRG